MLFSQLVILYYLADKWFWRNTILPPTLYILIRNEKNSAIIKRHHFLYVFVLSCL